MMPKPDVSEERTNQILEAALKVFAERGLHQARMKDIGNEAGLSKGTLYLYFKSKDALIAKLLEHLIGYELGSIAALRDASEPAEARLMRLMEAMIADLERMRPLMPIMYEFFAMGMRREAIRQVLRAYLRQFFEIVTPIIQQGIDQGAFRPVDAQEAAISVGALFEGTLLLAAYDPETIQPERHIRAGIDLLLEGLRMTNHLEV